MTQNIVQQYVKDAVDALTALVTGQTTLLNEAVEDMNEAVAQLDEVSGAEAGAIAARDAAEGYRDQALGHAGTAAFEAANAASAVSYQDLSGIAASLPITATALFWYPPADDSDGGAWRAGGAHLSWFTEARSTGPDLGAHADETAARAHPDAVTGAFYYDTGASVFRELLDTSGVIETARAGWAEFPANALLTAEAGRVIIWDATGPSVSMWMVFTKSTNSGVTSYGNMIGDVDQVVNGIAMINGHMCAAGEDAFFEVNFLSEVAQYRATSGSGLYKSDVISDRNAEAAFVLNSGVGAIVNADTRAVAMTVAPGAPVDVFSGLPIPTIVIGTGEGLSIVHADGSIANITHTSSQIVENLALSPEGELAYTVRTATPDTNYFVHVHHELPTADLANGNGYTKGSSDEFYVHDEYTGDLTLPVYRPNIGSLDLTETEILMGSQAGLHRIKRNPYTPGAGAQELVTTDLATGFLIGDVKGAWLASIDPAPVFSDNIVQNGDFSTGDLTGWSTFSRYATVINNQCKIEDINNADGYLRQILTTVPGEIYTVKFELIERTTTKGSDGRLRVDQNGWGRDILEVYTGSLPLGFHQYSFMAKSTTSYFQLMVTGENAYHVIDNVSVSKVEPDLSGNDNHLAVNGTISRTPVATGAEVVKFGPFSSTQFFELGYSADFDYPADFYACGWIDVHGIETYGPMFDRGYFDGAAYSGARWVIDVATTEKLRFSLGDGAASVTVESASAHGAERLFVCGVRDGDQARLYINDRLDASVSAASVGSLVNTDASLRIGYRLDNQYNGLADGIWQLRTGAGAPSARQIQWIYKVERFWFQPNAKITLPGTSDAILDVAYDRITGLHHVVTAEYHAAFRMGVLEYSEAGTWTKISAHNGLVVKS